MMKLNNICKDYEEKMKKLEDQLQIKIGVQNKNIQKILHENDPTIQKFYSELNEKIDKIFANFVIESQEMQKTLDQKIDEKQLK